jgi:hypothetical protein
MFGKVALRYDLGVRRDSSQATRRRTLEYLGLKAFARLVSSGVSRVAFASDAGRLGRSCWPASVADCSLGAYPVRASDSMTFGRPPWLQVSRQRHQLGGVAGQALSSLRSASHNP